MAIIEKGTFFLDLHATKNFEENDKFMLVMSEAEFEDDVLLCFSLNTEHRMDLYHVGCNGRKAKFILSPDLDKFSFLKRFTYLKLDEPLIYKVKELFEDSIKVYESDKANEILLRQINNCIDRGYLTPKQVEILKQTYNSKKT